MKEKLRVLRKPSNDSRSFIVLYLSFKSPDVARLNRSNFFFFKSSCIYLRKSIIKMSLHSYVFWIWYCFQAIICFTISVSQYMPCGELLKLWQEYGSLPEEIVRLYVAEIALALGK